MLKKILNRFGERSLIMTTMPAELPKGLSATIIALCFVPSFIIWLGGYGVGSQETEISVRKGSYHAYVNEEGMIVFSDEQNTQRSVLLVAPESTQPEDHVTQLAISSQGQYLAASFSNNEVFIWDIAKSSVLQQMQYEGGQIVVLSFDPEGKLLFIVSREGAMNTWDVLTGEPYTIQLPSNESSSSLRFYNDLDLQLEQSVRGSFIYTIVEWTAVCVALFTGVMAFIHYFTIRDVSTPIIGTALFFSGLIDAFNVMSVDHIINSVEDTSRFLPFTWAISRIFNVTIMTMGTWLVLYWKPGRQTSKPQNDFRSLLLGFLLFALGAYAIVHYCSVAPVLPQAIYPDAYMAKRPWDIPPLILLLLAGTIFFPRFYQRQPSMFSYGLLLSVIPHLATQIHAAFWSTHLYDAHFFAAHFLKLLAYSVPCIGLLLDYVRVYESESEYFVTQEKLKLARSVQQNLLPSHPPTIDGLDLLGRSFSSDSVGGDYFDFVPMANNNWGIVVADVSGHDLGASIFMAQTRAYLRALSSENDDIEEIVSRLNQFLTQDSRTHRFVTFFLAKISPASDQMEYVAAGHQSFLFHTDQEHELLGPTGPPLGVVGDVVQCEKRVAQLHPGSTFVGLTDGILETRNVSGTMFGNDRVVDTVQPILENSSAQIVDQLIQTALNFSAEKPEDDITMAVVKWLGNAE